MQHTEFIYSYCMYMCLQIMNWDWITIRGLFPAEDRFSLFADLHLQVGLGNFLIHIDKLIGIFRVFSKLFLYRNISDIIIFNLFLPNLHIELRSKDRKDLL